MLNFSQYTNEQKIDSYLNEDRVISKTALEKLLVQKDGAEFCLLKTTDPMLLREHFRTIRHPLYPIAATENGTPTRVYAVFKKPKQTSETFREIVNEAFYSLNNFSLLYTNQKILKTLENETLLVESVVVPTLDLFESKLSGNIKLLGLEVPRTKQQQILYFRNNLLSFPLTEHDLKEAKTWKTMADENNG